MNGSDSIPSVLQLECPFPIYSQICRMRKQEKKSRISGTPDRQMNSNPGYCAAHFNLVSILIADLSDPVSSLEQQVHPFFKLPLTYSPLFRPPWKNGSWLFSYEWFRVPDPVYCPVPISLTDLIVIQASQVSH